MNRRSLHSVMVPTRSNRFWGVLRMSQLRQVQRRLNFVESLSFRFNSRRMRTEPNTEKGPGFAPGPNPFFNQNGAGSAALAASSIETGEEAFTSRCGSPRSSLRTTSARMDHDVILSIFDFLPLSFGCS